VPRFLVINGPNLNRLGRRDHALYGSTTLADIERAMSARAAELGVEVDFFQSNHEGGIVDYIQERSTGAAGIIINAGALTQVGFSILDALLDAGLPAVEVHISNIHAREEFRRRSVLAPFVKGQVAGLGWRGYLYALDFLAASVAPARRGAGAKAASRGPTATRGRRLARAAARPGTRRAVAGVRSVRSRRGS
jgi:3-dehydroquinate dehydratase-2